MIDGFDGVVGIEDAFDQRDALKGCTVLFAEYSHEGYEGSAIVVFVDSNGVLFEVHGSHCSCRGLEGQWSPEDTTASAILMRPDLSEELKRTLAALYPILSGWIT